MNIRNLAMVSFVGFTLSGCATVMNGANQDMIIETEPKGAIAKLTNGFTCTTPCKVELPRKHDLRVDLTREGYRPTYVLVQSKLGGSTFGNILAGGLVGAVVDSSSGASNKLSPNPVSVRLVADGATGEEVLLDKKGKETGTVAAHNDKVRVDVAKSIGSEAAGLAPQGTTSAAPAPETSPAPTGS
jgi:PEGA domain